jgi:SAM-dependent methyltransferase
MEKQSTLNSDQLSKFYLNNFATRQSQHFLFLTKEINIMRMAVLDIGGGIGAFARALKSKSSMEVIVLDSDEEAVRICKEYKSNEIAINAVIGDALNPPRLDDVGIVCFNLILHHLVGKDEAETKELQKKALTYWRDKAQYIFINEYIYDSYILNCSGRIIYLFTSNKILSKIATLVGKFIPTLRANTSGVGVRFRAHKEWVKFFDECGYKVAGKVIADNDYVSPFLRLLLIDKIRTDSFLLKPNF